MNGNILTTSDEKTTRNISNILLLCIGLFGIVYNKQNRFQDHCRSVCGNNGFPEIGAYYTRKVRKLDEICGNAMFVGINMSRLQRADVSHDNAACFSADTVGNVL